MIFVTLVMIITLLAVSKRLNHNTLNNSSDVTSRIFTKPIQKLGIDEQHLSEDHTIEVWQNLSYISQSNYRSLPKGITEITVYYIDGMSESLFIQLSPNAIWLYRSSQSVVYQLAPDQQVQQLMNELNR
ncbi:MAG: hypothetical protein CMF25_03215 [Kangiellaceae bacterium]|nr:hypothetical protein [Kangiellaceae bacterium]|tara:strand:+ start:30551 stop:30937 length:387 start_codon:yes stop_codon:yes gene_type:complete